jgi:hypothetical protein
MIIAEADPNIDTHMQMLGRVHRTGQVIAPAYTHLAADIPAEVRPTAVLMRKMASLNANTTGAAKSRFTSEAVDFLNKYGDRVAQKAMREDIDTYLKLGEPISLDDDASPLGAAAAVTGRLTLLPPAEQQQLLDRITTDYKALIDALDATGTNDLEAKSVDLRARVLDTQTVKRATGPSPFQGAVNLDRTSVKSQGRAMSPADVQEAVAKALQTESKGEFAPEMRRLEKEGRQKQEEVIKKTRTAAGTYLGTLANALKDPDAQERAKAKVNLDYRHFNQMATMLHPGARVELELGGEAVPAVVIGFEQKPGAKSPVAPSSWQATFAMPSGMRTLGLPISRLLTEAVEGADAVVVRPSDVPHQTLEGQFEQAQKEGREDRYMFSGNLLAAFDHTDGLGQIVQHTMEDGSTRPAILMPRGFNPKAFAATRAARFANGDHVLRYLEKAPTGELVKSSDGIIKIRKDYNGNYVFEVPAARAQGGKYYTDKTVRDVYDNWERRGSTMFATLTGDRAEALIDALMKIDALFETRRDQETVNALAPAEQQAKAPARELEQRGLANIKLGTKSVITLMKEANPSSAVHELGHDWLEQLKRDAAHDQAPGWLRDDWREVMKWVGAQEGGEIPTKGHEKFARGFEQYLREGVAPSPGLAGVFQRFKTWLMNIYQTLKGLGSPITPEISGVFDRMLAAEKQPTVIAPERTGGGPSLADIHEADAAETEPHEADAAQMRVRAEAIQQAAELPLKVQHELQASASRLQAPVEGEGAVGEEGRGPGGVAGGGSGGAGPAGETGGGQPEPAQVVAGGGGPESLAGGGGGGAGSRPVVDRSGNAGAEGASLPAAVRSNPRAALENSPLAPGAADTFPDERRFVDKAGNFRLDNVNTAEDVKDLLREVAAANKDFIGERRGVITQGQVLELADALAMDADELDERQLGEAFNAEQIKAAEKVLAQGAFDARNAALKAKQTDSEADWLAYVEARSRLQMIQGQFAGITAEAGRALAALKKTQAFWGEGAMAANDVIKMSTARTLWQMKLEANLLSQLDTAPKVNKFLRDNADRSLGRMIVENFINAIISNPATHVIYTVGNAMILAEKMLVTTPGAALIGEIRARMGYQGDRVRLGEVAAGFEGLARGVAPALRAVGQALVSGARPRLPGEAALRQPLPFQPETGLTSEQMVDLSTKFSDLMPDVYGMMKGLTDWVISSGALVAAGGEKGSPLFSLRYSILGDTPDIAVRGINVLPIGTFIRMPGRMVSAMHTLMNVLNYSVDIHQRAYRTAAGEGLTGEALEARTASLSTSPEPSTMVASSREVLSMTLMGQNGEFLRKLTRIRDHEFNLSIAGYGLGKTPLVKLIDPFIQILGQMNRQGAGRFGLFAAEIRADLAGKNGVAAHDIAWAKLTSGAAIGLAFAGLAAQGLMSGAGPDNPHDREAWLRQGNQPYSIRIGDFWYPLHKLGAMGQLAGLGASLYEFSHQASEGEMQKATATFLSAFAKNYLDEGFLRGPADLMKALTDHNRYGERYLSNFMGSMIPWSAFLRNEARAIDPYMRTARTLREQIQAQIPFLSESLLPARDIWGEPVPNLPALGGREISALYMSRATQDPVELALAKLNFSPAMPSRRLLNVPLTEQQYDDYARISGRMAKIRLDQFVRSPDWAVMPPHAQHDLIQAVMKQSRTAAQGVLFQMYPTIPRDAALAKKARLQR